MKRLNNTMRLVLFMLGVVALAIFATSIDVSTFIASPLDCIIDTLGPGIAYATFPFYGAVQWPEGSPNMPGTRKDVYFVPLGGIKTFPAVKVSPTNPEDYHTLDGVLELNANCNVIHLYTTYGTNAFKAEPEGETDGKYFKLSGEFFHPGDLADIVNFSNAVINTPGVLFIPMGGYYMVLGNKEHPVYITPSYDTGKVGEGRKGTTFQAEAWSQLMITKYEGELPLTPPVS